MEHSSTKAQKVQAMKSYKRAHFLYNFVLYSLTSLITCLFFSYPFWLPFMSQFLSSLPNNAPVFLNAKCFFIVANLIIFILIGEFKFTQSSKESPVPDIYDEYMARCKSAKLNANFIKEEEEKPTRLSLTNVEEKKHGINEKKIYHRKEKKREMRASKSMHRLHQHHEEKQSGLKVSKSEVWDKREIEKREEDASKGEKDIYMPEEELNKRVEAFIARVNKQRLLEAKLVDHSRG